MPLLAEKEPVGAAHLRRPSSLTMFPVATVLAAIALTLLSTIAFTSTAKLGFLLDDFFHLNYLIAAFTDDPNRLLHLLWSNWSSDTTLTSYRPVVSFSLAADYFFWHTRAIGYHITNIAMFSMCTLLVAAVTRELSTRFSLRNPGWAGLLAGAMFAVYPLHPEAVGWIIGRVDLLCTLFSLGCVYAYLREKTLPSVVLLILAMASKEMAVTIPLVLTIFEWLAPNGRIKKTIPLWATLAVFAIWRTLILGTVVGGYGGTGWKAIKQGFKNFADTGTLTKLFFGANEEFYAVASSSVLRTACGASVLGLFASALLAKPKPAWRLYSVLLIWTLVSILPTFQIWHIWPNLVGSRLFFLGSAPLCMLLGVAAASYRRVGIPSALTLCVVWMLLLQSNLQAWSGAAARLETVRQQLQQEFPKLSATHKLLLVTLPQDYKGAPILGRPEYVSMLCQPPFADRDYTPYVLTTEPIIAGGIEYVGPRALARAKQASAVQWVWDDKAGFFITLPTGETDDVLLDRVEDAKPNETPAINVFPSQPLSLAEREAWLHTRLLSAPTIMYDCTSIPNTKYARIYVARPWQPITNAPRPVPPEKQFVELETTILPPRGVYQITSVSKGVHDVTVMAFDKNDHPIGLLSETVSITSP